jgi:hypothetical protein
LSPSAGGFCIFDLVATDISSLSHSPHLIFLQISYDASSFGFGQQCLVPAGIPCATLTATGDHRILHSYTSSNGKLLKAGIIISSRNYWRQRRTIIFIDRHEVSCSFQRRFCRLGCIWRCGWNWIRGDRIRHCAIRRAQGQ